MANLEHSAITDTDGIHEPKGAGLLTAGASDVGKVYLSDGVGSGAWALPQQAHLGAHMSIGDSTLNTTATTLTAQDIWYPVAGLWVEEHTNGMTTVPATGRLVVVTDGDYNIWTNISFIASTSSDVLNLAFMVNGVKVSPRIRRKLGTGADVGSMSLNNELHNLVAGDYIQLCIATISTEPDSFPAGSTITIENGNMHCDLQGVT